MTRKNIFSCAFILIVMVAACTEDAEVPSLSTGPPYIQFNTNTVNDFSGETFDEPDNGETDTLELIVENPFGSLKTDVKVTYTLGGSAVFGTDYTLEGASATGGEIVIVNFAEDDTLDNGDPSSNPDEYMFKFALQGDGVVDGNKTIELRLTEAVAEGSSDIEFTAGRPGLPDRNALDFTIVDADE